MEAQNCVITISSVMSSTALSNTAPLSYTETTFIPYSNGLIPIFVSSTAWEAVIFLSFWHTVCSVVSSIVPFTILVGILSVWKKFVCDGSRPVGPAGSFTSIGAITPALAPAGTLFSVTVMWLRRHVRIIVFLPIRIVALPRSLMRISCICFEPTKSTPTMRAFGQVSRRLISLAKYAGFLDLTTMLKDLWGKTAHRLPITFNHAFLSQN